MPKHNWNWTKFDVTVGVPPNFFEPLPRDADAATRVAAAGPRPIDLYVENYWKSRGMAVPKYPHSDDERPVHVFEDGASGVDEIDDDL